MQLLKSLLFATCLCSAWAGAYPTSSIPEDASAQHQSRSKLVARRFRSSISHALAGLIGASVGLLAGAAVESGRYKREDRRVWQNYSEALAPLDAYEREVIRTATIREISQWSEVPAEVAKCVVVSSPPPLLPSFPSAINLVVLCLVPQEEMDA